MKITSLVGGSLVLLLACDTPSARTGGTASCTPLETREPNASGQVPNIGGQTRACAVAGTTLFDVTVVASGLSHPWAVEPLPDGSFLITEKPGRLRIVSVSGVVGEPIAGLPAVDAGGQGGLLDVALSPAFSTDRTIYWSYTEPRAEGGNGTSVSRGVLSQDGSSLGSVQVIFRALLSYSNNMHFGSRLVFGSDGSLFVTTGDRSDTPMREYAQRLDSHLGKVLRISPDGVVRSPNPFVADADARKEVYSLGHRNIQAAALDGQGRLWIVEHGPNGGDELNLVEGGKNYGWPLQSYGEEYSGGPIRSAATYREGMQQPVYYWDPVIAPSGAQWYTGDAFPEWKGNLFVGALKEMRLVRLVLRGDRVVGEEHLLTERKKRIRDVRQGPDGFLYLVTDDSNGELLRISPRR